MARHRENTRKHINYNTNFEIVKEVPLPNWSSYIHGEEMFEINTALQVLKIIDFKFLSCL